MDEEQVESTKKALCQAAHHYASLCPQLSSFLMTGLAAMPRIKGQKSMAEHSVCCKCGSLFSPGNHSVRLKPKMKLTKRLSKLMKRQQSNPDKMGKCAKHMLDLYKNDANRLIYKCFICKQRTVIEGLKRQPRLFHRVTRTPQNRICKGITPVSSSKKDKTTSKSIASTSAPSRAADISKVSTDNLCSTSLNTGSNLRENNPSNSSAKKMNISVTPISGNNKRSTPKSVHSDKKFNQSHTPNQRQTPPTFLTDSSGNSSAKKKAKITMHKKLQELLKNEERRKASGQTQNSSLQDFLTSL